MYRTSHRWFLFTAALALACSDDPGQLDSGALPSDLSLDGPPVDSALAPDAGAAPTGAITGVVATYTLGASHTMGYGLAYDPDSTPHRLYASDYDGHKIYAYEVGETALTPLPSADLDTKSLESGFIAPRGLAYAKVGGKRTLFALTSRDLHNDGLFTSHLWWVDLSSGKPTAIGTDLSKAAFGLKETEVFGLAHRGGELLVSYDTSRFTSDKDQVRRGILRVKLGAALTAAGHMPHSGRKTSGSKYLRAPAFGLAAGNVEGRGYLFATSYYKYLYAAAPDTGRGLFHWASPGNRAIIGLAFGGGHLWALDRAAGPDRVHKVRVAGDWGAAALGARRVRRLSMRIKSTAFAAKPTPGVTHNFALPHPTTRRPNQHLDEKSLKQSLSTGAKASRLSYDPAGDSSARQEYLSVAYASQHKAGDELASRVEMDFWSADRRHYLYPHRVDRKGAMAKGYLADAKLLYGMSDTATYNKFIAAVKAAVTAEYGTAAAATTNPYWIARDVMEFILERYDYGNVSNASAGHYSYNPANLKLALCLDTYTGNDKMSCSTSTFAMSGVMRSLGIPTRWVGTTKRRGGWDKDKDGLRTGGEDALDTSFHRWPEVWLGSTYGWQRFDPTPPSDGPRELSQYELMAKAAQGVRWTDLVLTLGAGVHEPFFRQKDGNQRYNTVPRYTAALDWTDTVYRSITWSNPCSIKITGPTSPVSSAGPTITWTLTGRWDLDPSATLSISLQELDKSGTPYGARVTLASKVPASAGKKVVNLAAAKKGSTYRVEVRKDGDSETGALGAAFLYSP